SAPPISSWSSISAARFLPTAAMPAPAWANRKAVALPIPEVAPVTSRILFANSLSMPVLVLSLLWPADGYGQLVAGNKSEPEAVATGYGIQPGKTVPRVALVLNTRTTDLRSSPRPYR